MRRGYHDGDPNALGFFEVQCELVHAAAAPFRQPGLGKTPEQLAALNVPLAAGKFVLLMMHVMMFEPNPTTLCHCKT